MSRSDILILHPADPPAWTLYLMKKWVKERKEEEEGDDIIIIFILSSSSSSGSISAGAAINTRSITACQQCTRIFHHSVDSSECMQYWAYQVYDSPLMNWKSDFRHLVPVRVNRQQFDVFLDVMSVIILLPGVYITRRERERERERKTAVNIS